MPHHSIDQVTQPIAHIQIGMIDLMYVTREDHLGPLACSSDDRFYLKRGQVLCFIDNEENLLEASSTDVSQWKICSFSVSCSFGSAVSPVRPVRTGGE